MSDEALQQTFAAIAAETQMRPPDVRALANVTDPGDAAAILLGYVAGNKLAAHSLLESIVTTLTEAAAIAGIVLPIFNLVPAIKNAIDAL